MESVTGDPEGTTVRPSEARKSPETKAVTVCPSEFRNELIESWSRARICVPDGTVWRVTLVVGAGIASAGAEAESEARMESATLATIGVLSGTVLPLSRTVADSTGATLTLGLEAFGSLGRDR